MKHKRFHKDKFCNGWNERLDTSDETYKAAIRLCNPAESYRVCLRSHRCQGKISVVTYHQSCVCTSVCSGFSGGFQVLMQRIDMVRSKGIPCRSLEIPRGALRTPANSSTHSHFRARHNNHDVMEKLAQRSTERFLRNRRIVLTRHQQRSAKRSYCVHPLNHLQFHK